MRLLLSAPLGDKFWQRVTDKLISDTENEFFFASFTNYQIFENSKIDRFIDLCKLNDYSNDSLCVNDLMAYFDSNQINLLRGIFFSASFRCGLDRCSVIEKEMNFKIILGKIIYILKEKKIDIVCFDVVPHTPWELLTWEIMKILNKRVFCFKRTGPANAIYLEQEIFGNKSNPFKLKDANHPISKIKDESLVYEYLKKYDFTSFQKEGKWNFKDKHKKKISFKNKLKNLIKNSLGNNSIKYFLNSFSTGLLTNIRKHKYASKYSTDISLISLREFNTRLDFLLYNLFYGLEIFQNKNYLDSISISENNLPKKYIYFPLHMQPESSTLPQGIYWVDMLSAIKYLRECAGDIPIIVKEHPNQFNYDIRKYKYRSIDFYKKISNIKNVFFINYKTNSIFLTKRAYAVAGICGNNIWESIMIGKNVIQFTKQLHSSISYCFCVVNYSKEELKLKIRNFKEISDNEKKLEIYKYISENSNYLIHSGLYINYIKAFFNSNLELSANNICNCLREVIKIK